MATEKRLIPLSKRIVYAGDVFNSLMSEYKWSATEASEFVKKFQTVDAVEVVHGRWKKLPYHPYRCSICDEIAPLDQSGEFHYTSNYCPNCGADMRERKDND